LQENFQASFEEVDDCENLFVYMPMNQIGFDFKIQKKKHGSSFLGQKPNMEIEKQCQQDRI
jgi:hypothetical protein